MLTINDQNLDHELEIESGGSVYLKYSADTHAIEGFSHGTAGVDIYFPWWGLSDEQQAALDEIHEKANQLIQDAARIIAGGLPFSNLVNLDNETLSSMAGKIKKDAEDMQARLEQIKSEEVGEAEADQDAA